MSRIPRTPVYFPRMKVRGKRNRAKLKPRLEVFVIPHAALTVNEPGRQTFEARVGGGHHLRFQRYVDGWGRTVRAPRPKPKPRPLITPDSPEWSPYDLGRRSWSMDISFGSTVDPDGVLALLGAP